MFAGVGLAGADRELGRAARRDVFAARVGQRREAQFGTLPVFLTTIL